MKFPAMALTPSLPRNRGRYDLRMDSWGGSLGFLRHLERIGFGQYRWPIRADNDRDHVKW